MKRPHLQAIQDIVRRQIPQADDCAPDAQVQAGSVMLNIAPQSGAVYLPHNPYSDYNFFKPRNSGEVGVATIPARG